MRHILRILALMLAVPFLYLAASFALPFVPGPGPDYSGTPARTIGLLQGPIHTDILFPLNAGIRAQFAFAEAAGVPLDHRDAQWMILGWGSAAFYTTAGTYADITASAVLTAAMGDDAVIRLGALGPGIPTANLRFLSLSEQQYQALLAEVGAAFASHTRLDSPGFTADDAFFPAKGRFHAFNTCNVWLGTTFRAAGIPFGLWTPANWSVALSINWHLMDRTG